MMTVLKGKIHFVSSVYLFTRSKHFYDKYRIIYNNFSGTNTIVTLQTETGIKNGSDDSEDLQKKQTLDTQKIG